METHSLFRNQVSQYLLFFRYTSYNFLPLLLIHPASSCCRWCRKKIIKLSDEKEQQQDQGSFAWIKWLKYCKYFYVSITYRITYFINKNRLWAQFLGQHVGFEDNQINQCSQMILLFKYGNQISTIRKTNMRSLSKFFCIYCQIGSL